MCGYVYILKSKLNGRYYVGSSENPERRLLEFHNLGKVKATKNLIPWEIFFSQFFSSMVVARQAEYWLKRQKDKDFLNKVIEDGKLTKFIG